MDRRNWVVVLPAAGQPLVNVGSKDHFALLDEIAPDLQMESNYWAAGRSVPDNEDRILARGHINLLGRIRFDECPRNRNSIYDLVAEAIGRRTAKKKFRETPFSDPINILELFVARAMNEAVPDELTIAEVTRYGMGLASVPKEEMLERLEAIVEAENPAAALRLAQETKCLRYMVPPVDNARGFWQRHKKTSLELFQHLMIVFDYVCKHSDRVELRWAALLHDIGKMSVVEVDDSGVTHFPDHHDAGAKEAEQFLKGLGMDAGLINRVCFFIRMHMFDEFDSKKDAKQFIADMGGVENALDMLTLRMADMQGKKGQDKGEDKVQEMRKLVDKVENKWERIDGDESVIVILKQYDII
jgi:putative nucleotidyltransferase with HDIG domain